MSLESSHERTEQLGSATAAETDHSPVVQGDSGEEQLPANVTPAPVPPDPDELMALLLSWIHTSDWSASQTYLQAHPELLTEAAIQALITLTQRQSDQQARNLLMLHQRLLRTASRWGVEAAYQALLHQEDEKSSATVETEQEELLVQVAPWLLTPDWETSRAYLHTHPRLLTDAAEQMLEEFFNQAQKEKKVQASINLHLKLLQKARVEGIEAAYENLLAPDPETLHIDREVVNSQNLENPATWNAMGTAAMERYRANWQIADLNRALECWHEALNQALPNSSDRPFWLTNLGLGLRDRYHLNGELVDLEAAISAFQQSLQATPSDSSNWPARQNNLGAGLFDRYHRSGNLSDLEAAISAYQQALQAAPPNTRNLPHWLHNLGLGLRDRYHLNGDLADLEAAINAFQQALQAAPLNEPDRMGLLNGLGVGLHDRYNRTRDLADLEAAISAYQQALQATPPNAPIWPLWLNNLGNGLRDRYSRTGDLTDLDAAISAYQQALQATPPNAPNRSIRLNNLGLGLRDRYSHTRDLTDLEAAISAFQQALQATPPDAPDRPLLLNNLGSGLQDRYSRTRDLTDLEAAISAFQQALQAAPSNSSDRSDWLNNLGLGLRDRYSHTRDLTDLEAAISAFQQALQTTPPDAPDRPLWLNNLGLGLRDRYRLTGEPTNLEAAISSFQQALQATPSDSSDQSIRLTHLGIGLHDRYRRSGDLADLEAAISSFQQALQATPPDSPNRPLWLNSLGIGLNDRYSLTGGLTDLEAAINAFQQALQATLPDSSDRPVRLNNLGGGLRDRYSLTGDLADLEAAISSFQQALQATPSDSPNRPVRLNNLGLGLRDRYSLTGDLADLEAAISSFQQALQATPSDSPNRPLWLNNLGLALRDRYDHSGDPADLQAALTVWEKRWSALSLHFASLPVIYKLGQQRQESDINSFFITSYLEHAARHRPSAKADRRSAFIMVEGNKSRLLTQLVGRGPLPLPTGLSPQIADREQQLLTELITLDTQELTIHDHFASTQGETSRRQLLQQKFLAALATLDTPEMAIRGQFTTTQEENSRLQRLQQRHAALRGLEDLWARVARVGPEGEAYVALRRGAAPIWQEFAHLAKALGPATALLSFFTTSDRALLFLLRAGWRVPRIVEIPLNQAGRADLFERFFREIPRYGSGLRRSETWDQPLRLLFTQAQCYLEGVERLILAPAGNGHLLPWAVLAERAGWRTSTGQPLSLVTLPALGVLPSLRQRQHVLPGPTLVVGNPCGDLPYAEVEANEVAERFVTKPLLGATATKSTVLTHLPEATLIHLATHAFFDADNPLESGIVLADGVLTAREILKHRLQADLLVLSACESGQIGSLGGEELAGLSQAFLLTGVRSLLVSLWRVNDPATAALMQAFYTARQAGADKALALRQAMTQIQQGDLCWSHPYYWGAFVLMGDWD